MERINGTPVKDIFEGLKKSEKSAFSSNEKMCEKIGESIAKLHNCKIIHGDLTSSI